MNAELAETAEKQISACSAVSALIFDLAYRLPANRAVTEARQNLGRLGENLACTELERRGYAILARRYRHAGAEIDIVARDGATLVFVEVKAREGRDFGDGAEAVTMRKRRRLAMAAMDYLVRHRKGECPCRFDVVSIQLDEGTPGIEVFQNAFDASGT
jgi:putative endonuclease